MSVSIIMNYSNDIILFEEISIFILMNLEEKLILKSMFGEYVYSARLKNMIQEMMLKASLYNKLISI